MTDDLIVASVGVFCFIFMIATQVVFWMHRKAARKNIITDWLKFLEAENTDDITLINSLGDKLIWNRYISQDQIDKLNNILSSHLEKHPIFSDLYEVTKNRKSYLSDDDKKRIYGQK